MDDGRRRSQFHLLRLTVTTGARPRLLLAVVLVTILAVLPVRPSLAQVQPAVRDRVVPAVVLIAIVANVTDNGTTEPLVLPMGSGTVVSAQGQILTNWHVVNMAEHRQMFQSWEAQAAADGHPVTIQLMEQSVLISTSDGISAPIPQYVATIAATDEAIDLAVLQIVANQQGPLDPSSLNIPFVPLGDSDAIGLGDPIDIFGYPSTAGGALIYTQGVVSGFQGQSGVAPRAWIITDATMSGGSSGGTAINRSGELIGVPTWGTVIECRPADLNQDGHIDAADVGCVPIGGSLGNLRPSNFARELLARAGQAANQAPSLPPQTPGSIPAPPALPQPAPQNSAVPLAVEAMLPTALPLAHSQCFRLEDEGTLTFDALTDRLGGSADTAARLQTWGWQASAYRTFACDAPPNGEAGWIDVSVHLFADPASAQQALDYFAAQRAAGTRLLAGAPPAIGDHAAVLSGPTTNGKEFTLYVSRGPLLIRITGVSPTGIPFINVLTVARAILQTPLPEALPTGPQDSAPSTDTVAAYLPESLPLAQASCFRADAIVLLDFQALVDRFPGVPDAAVRLQELGWQAGASRQFSCDNPPAGHVGWIDLSVHRFRDAASAAAAVPFFARSRALGATLETASAPSIGDSVAALAGPASNGAEYTLYMSTGPLLFRVTGVAPAGDPALDVQQVMVGVLVGGAIVGQRAIPQPTPTPVPATMTPTPPVLPTATSLPTATPIPTASPLPSPTPLLKPAAISTPTPVLLPTATASAVPTATSGPQPTPTPRTIAIPTAASLPENSGPTADANALVDRLLGAPLPESLLDFGSPGTPTLDDEVDHQGGLVGMVSIDTGGGGPIGASSISYSIYAGAAEAERETILWLEGNRDWLETQFDVSGPELGPHAVMLVDTDFPTAVCGAVVGQIVVRASAVGAPDTNADVLAGVALGNCEGAVAHLKSVLNLADSWQSPRLTEGIETKQQARPELRSRT